MNQKTKQIIVRSDEDGALAVGAWVLAFGTAVPVVGDVAVEGVVFDVPQIRIAAWVGAGLFAVGFQWA